MMNNQAKFVLYTGPMFSSKTTKLLSRIDRSKYQKKTSISFKPNIDDRYTVESQIVTHNDVHVKCVNVRKGEDILEVVAGNQPVDIIAIDELFMIPGGGDACIELFKKGYDVYVSSIELDYLGNPFREVKEIMPYCTQIVKCKAVCSVCQEDARYTSKKEETNFQVSTDSVLQVGGEETYEARCQLHHKHMCL
tara:strand:+ start:459 stop:1037 length:579 start_codon:yes stop_codon:yes gene_type:complete